MSTVGLVTKAVQVGVQTVCFSRFGRAFYRASLEALVGFVKPAARHVTIHLYIFLHDIALDAEFCLALAQNSPFPVTFHEIYYTCKYSRAQPELYARDVNQIYAETFNYNTMPYIFHMDGDVVPQSPPFAPTLGNSWLEEWAAIIEDHGSRYAAICNIGSGYFEPGDPILQFYRPYHYACDKYELRFSTQSFFCRRDLVAASASIDIALERHVTAKLASMGKRSLNLHRQDGFAWRHHYHGTST